MEYWLNGNNWRIQSTWRKSCPSATLPTMYPTWTTTEINLGLCGEMLAINNLNYGTGSSLIYDMCKRSMRIYTVFVLK